MKLRERVTTRRLPAFLLIGVLAGIVALCVVVMRGTIVAFDDWNFVLDRRGGRPTYIPRAIDQWLQPHNGHPVMVLVGIYRLVGVTAKYNYQVLIGIATFVHACLALAVYIYARRRLGPWAALVPSLLIALLGRGAPVVLSPIVMAFTLALVAGVGALNLVDRAVERESPASANTRALAVGILGLLAVMSSGLGVARVVSVGFDRIVRSRTRAMFVRWTVTTGAPALAFIIWYANVRDQARNTSALAGAVTFGFRVFANGVAGAVGLGSRWATAAGVGFTALAVMLMTVRRRTIDFVRVGALVVGLIVDLVLVSWARAGNALPASGRYIYVFAVQACLLLTELLNGFRWPRRIGATAAAITAIATLGAIVGGVGTFHDIIKEFRRDNHRTQVSLAAFIRAQNNGVAFAPDFQPEPEFAPQVSADRLHGLLADGKSPLPGRVPRANTENERRIVDYYDAATFLKIVPAGPALADSAFNFSGEIPVTLDQANIRIETRGSCTTFTATGEGAFADIEVPMVGASWHVRRSGGDATSAASEVTVRARLRGSGFTNLPAAQLSGDRAPIGGASKEIRADIPDRSSEPGSPPWILRIEPTQLARLCRPG